MDAREAQAWLHDKLEQRHEMTPFQWSQAYYLCQLKVPKHRDYELVKTLVRRQTMTGLQKMELDRLWSHYGSWIEPRGLTFQSMGEYYRLRYGLTDDLYIETEIGIWDYDLIDTDLFGEGVYPDAAENALYLLDLHPDTDLKYFK